jgi:hypothetical protein
MRTPLLAAALVILPLLTSCSTPPPAPYQMVDPRVMSVGNDGTTAKINIGTFDHVRPGELLYVVRDHKMIGMLTVDRISDYWSDCRVTASKTVSKMDPAASPLGDVRVGDIVMREFKDIADVGLPKERVPRMVPVPYQPADPYTEPKTPPPATELEARKLAAKQNIQLPVIPREQVDEWIKMHPTPAAPRP